MQRCVEYSKPVEQDKCDLEGWRAVAERMSQLESALSDLLEGVTTSIACGDWKVDGARDPDAAIRRADSLLEYCERKEKGCL